MAKAATPQAKAGAKRATPRNGGRKPWAPNDEQRLFVRFMSGRATQETIAAILGTTVDTMFKHCKKELSEGTGEADVMIEGALFRECMKGNTTAIIWWEKTRRGMKEIIGVDHNGSINLVVTPDDAAL